MKKIQILIKTNHKKIQIKKETTTNNNSKNQEKEQDKEQSEKPQDPQNERESIAKEKADLLAKLEAIRAQREKVQNEVQNTPFPPAQVKEAEEDAP